MDRQAMPLEKFIEGWKLLTAQPWGRWYRNGQEEADVQIELYYSSMKHVPYPIWQRVSLAHASGDKWPSITELKTACNAAMSVPLNVPKLERSSIEWKDGPEPIRLVRQYADRNGVTWKQAAEAVLPEWIAKHPHHEDCKSAKEYLESARGKFGVKHEQATKGT